MSKVLGRPKGSGKYPIRKHIYISSEMNKKWNPNKIRSFLESNGKNKISTIRESKDEIIPDLIRMVKSEKDSIPIELYRSLKLIFNIIEKRL